jgi:pantothenate kinase
MRSLTALAGPPAAGKSHIANALCDEINARDPNSAVVLPMDGYHLDDALLDSLGFRDRKGAPHTFDIAGFTHMLRRVSRAGKTDIAVPVFDRTLELSRAAARLIPGTARHILVEGNYLLLDQPGWRELARFFCNNGNDHRPKAVIGKPTDAKMAKLEPSTGKEKMRK